MAMDPDDEVRAAAFAYLTDLTDRTGGPVSRIQLESFRFKDASLRLIAPRQGIWRPRSLPAALSLVTTYTPPNEPPPYDDDIGDDGCPRYKWRGLDPMLHDNVALRRAMGLRKPLIWFIGIAAGIYRAEFPVWLVDEEPSKPSVRRRPGRGHAGRVGSWLG